jgi:retron-type reverse transcriptase
MLQDSESPIVLKKPGNQDPKGLGGGKGRPGIKKLKRGKMSETLSSGNVSTKLQQIAELARKHPKRVFTSISHVIDFDLMCEAYRRTRKDSAAGVDGEDAESFAENLEDNLRDLVKELHTGSYKAPPVRRVYIPKGDGKTRPIGIPTFADKVMQRAVAMVLEAIYETEFHSHSYGFRQEYSKRGKSIRHKTEHHKVE